jgi:putative hemolysin
MTRLIAIALAIVLGATGCGSDDDNPDEPGIANPASVYCAEQGGTVDIRTDADGNQTGYCVFADGAEVEEWAYYRGEADPAVPVE